MMIEGSRCETRTSKSRGVELMSRDRSNRLEQYHRRWRHGARAGNWLVVLALLVWLGFAGAKRNQAPAPPPDGEWTANAVLTETRAITDEGLGAVQGVVVRDGKVYAYGDVFSAKPRVGVIREYDLDLKPTGRVVWLRRNGEPLVLHPTGLTWNLHFGTLLGDTVLKKAVIYRLDWALAWKDGTLDRAVRDVIDDDSAINGCRPTFVTLAGRDLLATSDYGNIRPEIRLYDPTALMAAKRSSAPGVIVHRLRCGPFNQNMQWDADSGLLTCAQNVIEGRGWRIDVLDLTKAVAAGDVNAPGVRLRTHTFTPHDELEGYWPLDRERSLFAIARRSENIVVGAIKTIEPRNSPAGTR
jgi:hypothetical protein